MLPPCITPFSRKKKSLWIPRKKNGSLTFWGRLMIFLRKTSLSYLLKINLPSPFSIYAKRFWNRT